MSDVLLASGGAGTDELRLKLLESNVGVEFQVNAYTQNDQYYPWVAPLSGGRFVATWTSNGQDGSGWGIYGKVFDIQGRALSGEFQVNTYTSSTQQYSSVASLADGGFVIVWEDHNSHDGGSSYDVYGQRYDSDYKRAGGEFRINTYVSNYQYTPRVAGLKGGGFVATWRDDSGQGGSGYEVRGQVYDANGERVGYSFGVNTFKSHNQQEMEIAALKDGGFVIVWESSGQDGESTSYWNVYGQRYDDRGTPQGGEFRVNTYTNGYQRLPSVASTSDGGFVVTWEDHDGNGDNRGGSSSDIFGQRYDDDGDRVGGEFLVNSFTSSSQYQPSVTGLKDGGFVVAWRDDNGTNHDNGEAQDIWLKVFDGSGDAVGEEYRVHGYVSAAQERPSLAGLDDGGFVVAWESYLQDGDHDSVYARYFTADGAPFSIDTVLETVDVSGSTCLLYTSDAADE